MDKNKVKKIAIDIVTDEIKKSELTQKNIGEIFNTHQSRISTLCSSNTEKQKDRLADFSLDKLCEYLEKIGYTFKIVPPSSKKRLNWEKQVKLSGTKKRA